MLPLNNYAYDWSNDFCCFLESSEEELETIKELMDGLRSSGVDAARWMRLSHAALRLRCESPQWAREHAALQTRRDTCFSQAVSK